MTVTIELDAETEQRLQALAARTGEKTSDLLRNAVANGMEDLEEYFNAGEVLERLKKGEEKTYPLDQVMRELGLED